MAKEMILALWAVSLMVLCGGAPTTLDDSGDVTLDYTETTISPMLDGVIEFDQVSRVTELYDANEQTATEVAHEVFIAKSFKNETEHPTTLQPNDDDHEDSTASFFRDSAKEEPVVIRDGATMEMEMTPPEETTGISDMLASALNEVGAQNGPSAELLKVAASSVNDDDETITTRIAVVIESDAVTEPSDTTTDQPTEVPAFKTNYDDAAPVKILPPPVKIYDPSVDVEATTFLAEANLATEADYGMTIEYFGDDVTEADNQMGTVTTEEPESTARTEGDELESRSGDEVFVSRRRPRPSPYNSAGWVNKRRSYRGYKVLRVVLPTEEAVNRVLSLEDEEGIDFWADPRLLLRPRGLFVMSATDVLVAPEKVERVEGILREARLTYSALVDDVQGAISKENPGPSFARSQNNPSANHRLTWERYHRLADIESFLEYVASAHPEWIQVLPIGKSSQGRTINVIKMSRPGSSRFSGRIEPSQKKAILVDAGVHANEWITPAALTWMMNEIIDNAGSYDCILDRFDWYLIPMLNPDGYEYSHAVDRMWRKTRRNYTLAVDQEKRRRLEGQNSLGDEQDADCLGADINRNFEFHWRKGGSSNNVCLSAYAGDKPFSEPEARALANFMLKKRNDLVMYISLHSYSQMWLLPWGFVETRPEDFSELYSLAKVGARAVQRVHNTSYLIGSVPDLLALASGTSQDWAKGVAGVKYSYTLEMRDASERGMIVPAQQIISIAEETWAGLHAVAVELGRRLYSDAVECPSL